MSRRSAGEGSVYYSKSRARWVGQVYLDDGSKKIVIDKLQSKVVARIEKIRADAKQGLSTNDRLKLKDYLNEYLTLKENSVQYNSYINYKRLIDNHISPRLGNIKITKINPVVITNVWNKMKNDGVGVVTIRRCQSVLANAFNEAIARNLLTYNPANYATTPRAPDNEIRLLEDNAIQSILDYTEKQYSEYLPIITTAFQTGMRRSELCALRWGDVDLDLAVLYVNRTFAKAKNGGLTEKAPKTKAGRRKIDLSPQFAIYLRNYLESHDGEITPDQRVFRYTDGKQIKPDRITHVFKTIALALEMPDIHFHNTRHSHAGMLLKMGVHPKVVQERLGHSSIQVTMDIYSHVAPNLQKEAIQNFPMFTPS